MRRATADRYLQRQRPPVWATGKGGIVLRNATYRVHRADWAHFVEGPHADPEDVQQPSPLVMDEDNTAAKRVRAALIQATADSPDVIGAAHFPFGHVITVDGEHQFRFLE